MLSYTVYKLVHFLGIFLLVGSIGIGYAYLNTSAEQTKRPLLLPIAHGVGLFFALLGGFGMLARMGIHWPWPGWMIAKLIVWLFLGGLMVVFKRRLLSAPVSFGIGVVLVTLAGYFALWKPF